MKRSAAGGFTIVETMIVLAVSGVLFASLVGIIRGQQNKVQFKNSMTDVVSRIQSSIGEVATGYNPSVEGNFSCVVSGGVPQIMTEAGDGIGTNSDCTLMGQAIMFGTAMEDDTQQYKVHALIGLRRTSAGKEPANFSEAEIRVTSPGTSDPVTFFLDRVLTMRSPQRGTFASEEVAPPAAPGGTADNGDYSDTDILQFGTTIKWMRTDDTASSPISGFAIVTVPSGQAGSSLSSEPGAVLSSIIPIYCGSTANCEDGLDSREGVDAIENAFDGASGVAASAIGVKLCFLSAVTNQSSLVRVGANGGNNAIEMTIHNNQDCA